MAISSTFDAADGDGYNLQMGRWSHRLAGPFLDFAGIESREQVLDVGCGTGSLTYALAERTRAKRVDGIDFADVYVEYAKQHCTDERIHFRVGDACALPLEDDSYDAALSLLVLHFVPDAERAIAEMRRVTGPGGVVAAAIWDAGGGVVINRMFFDTAAALDPDAHDSRARGFTRPLTRPGELADAWRAAGLEDVTDTTLTIRMDFASFDDFWAPYGGKDGPYAAYVLTLDDRKRDRFKEQLCSAYLSGEADGPRSFAASAWAVRGRVPVPGAAPR